MSATFDHSVHPVLSCVASLESALKATADVQVIFMSPADKKSALLDLARVEAQLAGLRLRLMAASDGAPARAQEALFRATVFFERVVWLARETVQMVARDAAAVGQADDENTRSQAETPLASAAGNR